MNSSNNTQSPNILRIEANGIISPDALALYVQLWLTKAQTHQTEDSYARWPRSWQDFHHQELHPRHIRTQAASTYVSTESTIGIDYVSKTVEAADQPAFL